VQAPLPSLQLEVRGADGKPAASVSVELVAMYGARACAPLCADVATVLLRQPQGSLGPQLTVTTDTGGVARADAFLGTVSGPARLVIRVAQLGYTDTLRVAVQPGAPTTLRLLPADTALQIGRSYTGRGQVLDRLGNPTEQAVTLSTASTDISIAGQQINGVSFGSAQVQAAAGGLTATAHVSVVPAGTIAATHVPWVGPASVVVMSLDGSGRQVLPGTPHATVAAWSPDGASLLMLYDQLDQPDRIYSYDLGTAATRTLLDVVNHPRVKQVEAPRFHPDGQWIWFSGYESPVGNSLLWRMRPDGSGLELITPQTSVYLNAAQPYPSPDGSRLVYSGRRTSDDDWYALYLFDLSTGTHTRLINGGTGQPRWSPTGEWIVFGGSAGRPYLIRPDGTGFREIPRIDGWLNEWAPDGKFILVQGNLSWWIVEAATGESVRLPNAVMDGLTRAVWRPAA
jgi:Tol biopolymer transport system component